MCPLVLELFVHIFATQLMVLFILFKKSLILLSFQLLCQLKSKHYIVYTIISYWFYLFTVRYSYCIPIIIMIFTVWKIQKIQYLMISYWKIVFKICVSNFSNVRRCWLAMPLVSGFLSWVLVQ